MEAAPTAYHGAPRRGHAPNYYTAVMSCKGHLNCKGIHILCGLRLDNNFNFGKRIKIDSEQFEEGLAFKKSTSLIPTPCLYE
jgi:hypothetical protein